MDPNIFIKAENAAKEYSHTLGGIARPKFVPKAKAKSAAASAPTPVVSQDARDKKPRKFDNKGGNHKDNHRGDKPRFVAPTGTAFFVGNGAPSAGAATSSVHIGGGPPTSKVTVKTEQKVSIKQEPGVKDESMDVVGGDGACEPDEECTRDSDDDEDEYLAHCAVKASSIEHQSSSKGRYSPPAYNALDPVEVPFKSDWYRHSPFHSTFSQNGVYPHAFSAQVELEPNMQKMMRKYEDECSDKMSTGEKGQVYLLQLPSSLKGCCVKGATSGSTGGDSATNSTDASDKTSANKALASETPGCIGKMQLMKSGCVFMVTPTGERFEVNAGLSVHFMQSLVSVTGTCPAGNQQARVDPGMCHLGSVVNKLIVTPALDIQNSVKDEPCVSSTDMDVE